MISFHTLKYSSSSQCFLILIIQWKTSFEERYVVIFTHKRLFSSLSSNKSSDQSTVKEKIEMNEETLERDLRPPNELAEVICFSTVSCIPIQSFRETLLHEAALFLFLLHVAYQSPTYSHKYLKSSNHP